MMLLTTSLIATEEGATMVQVASLFNQLLHHFPRLEFAALVKKHKAERAAKGFDCWTQFVAMLFCQLGHADSLREICNGLCCCLGKLVHLGIAQAPNKSTLSYANEHRPAALYQELFYTVLGALPRPAATGRTQAHLPFQEQAALARLDHRLALLIPLPLGAVPPHQGRGQSACADGPRRLPAALRAAHRRPRQ